MINTKSFRFKVFVGVAVLFVALVFSAAMQKKALGMQEAAEETPCMLEIRVLLERFFGKTPKEQWPIEWQEEEARQERKRAQFDRLTATFKLLTPNHAFESLSLYHVMPGNPRNTLVVFVNDGWYTLARFERGVGFCQ